MATIKQIFARNLAAQMESKKLKANQLETLTKLKGNTSVTHSYIARVLRGAKGELEGKKVEAVNLTFDAAESLCLALDTTFEKMINPYGVNTASEKSPLIDINKLTQAQLEAETIALDAEIRSRDFVRVATAIYYNGLVNNDESQAYREIMKVSRNY